jgi:DNA (cytosine-5)-methyltransferase 1
MVYFMKKGDLYFIDLFAGAGGLSEGFIAEGFIPCAHVEMDEAACDTLKTRTAYHHLRESGRIDTYVSYLTKEISRADLWGEVPSEKMDGVINSEISESTIDGVFKRIDAFKNKKIHLIIGGPPCQAYSIAGRSRDPNRMRGDKRNYLFKFYSRFLERYKPEFFVFENVLGLLTAGSRKYLDEMTELFQSVGYNTVLSVLDAKDFGVLQSRRRVIIIGHRRGRSIELPAFDRSTNNYQIARDLFYDLPRLRHGQELEVARYSKPMKTYLKDAGIRGDIDIVTQNLARRHNERDLEIYAIAIEKWLGDRRRLRYDELPETLQTHRRKDVFLDRFKVVDPKGCSHTVVAHIAKDGHYYIHPDPRQLRSITVREAARIQSFPDDYYFEGGRTAAFRQIGNAVPPLMARAVAVAIKKLYK